MQRLVWSVVWACAMACGRLHPDEGDAGISAGTPAIEGGAAGSLVGTPAFVAGSPALATGGSPNVGGSGSATVSAGAPSASPASHARECILDRLARPPTSDGSGGAESVVPAGTDGQELAGAGGGGTIDLGLGAGDLTVLVVFDKSGSMAERWDERSRWQVANEAFLKAIEGVLDNLTLGAIFFPEPGGCDVSPLGEGAQIELAPGREFDARWRQTLETRRPDGSTPLEGAFHVADGAIERGCQLGLLSDRFRVLLVTDGEPTCNDDPSALVGYAEEWRRIGIETWVMGIPGSTQAAALLDAIAAAGGTERHQSFGAPSELDDGLYEATR